MDEQPTVEDVMALRILVRAREDFQGQRKRMDNRIGRKADKSEQNIPARPFRPDDLVMFGTIADACREQEDAMEKALKKALARFPIYNLYLKNVKGIGPIAAAKMLSSFDIVKATTVSKMWQYAGISPGMVIGKKCVKKSEYKSTMGKVIAEYEESPGREASYLIETDELIRGDKLTPGFVSPFNKDLRAALVGVLADGFIKAQAPYAMNHYYPYKARLEQEEYWKDESKGHRDRAAKRYMIKMFLKDLYVAWRTLEGLPMRVPYQEEYLGHKHSA